MNLSCPIKIFIASTPLCHMLSWLSHPSLKKAISPGAAADSADRRLPIPNRSCPLIGIQRPRRPDSHSPASSLASKAKPLPTHSLLSEPESGVLKFRVMVSKFMVLRINKKTIVVA